MDVGGLLIVGGGLLLAVAVSFMALFAHRQAKAQKDAAGLAWGRAARELGLKHRWDDGMHAIAGEVDGLSVWVEDVRSGEAVHTRIRIAGQGHISKAVDFRREGAFAGLARAFDQGDVQLDEAAFDDQVHVTGPKNEVLAALSATARKFVYEWVSAGGTVENGNLFLETNEQIVDAQRLLQLVRHSVAGAWKLTVESVPRALQENAARDPNARVRKRNLEVLAAEHAGTSEAREALHVALGDALAETRLFAAQALVGEEDARVALAELVEDVALPDELRARALERLVEGHPYDRVAATVASAVAADPLEPTPLLKRAAIKAVAFAKDASRLGPLAAMARDARLDAGVAEELAWGLGELGGEQAEPALLALLSHEVSCVTAAAATALGKVGTIRAVEPLLPLSKGVLAGTVRDAARDAVHAIQRRLGNVEGGGLSVVDGQASGGLSVPSLPSGTKDRSN